MPAPALIPSFPGALSATGLILDAGLPFDRWSEIGEMLRGIERSVMWWIGDWTRYGERHYGETYAQALDATDYGYETLRAAKWVADRFETVRRRTDLSWSHHREVAPLDTPEQDRLLDEAAKCGWSQKALRAAVNQHKNARAAGGGEPLPDCIIVDDLLDLARAGRKVGTIYADPPWDYGNQVTRAATGNHYPTMPLAEIAALPVADIVADDAHLHLWTTNGFLFDAKAIMEAWGFTYKSCFVWVKPSFGIGNYWRVSHEFLLFGRRGKAKFSDHSLRSWAEIEADAHSVKPEEVRSFVERASPAPRLEMFARRAEAPGWMVWGHIDDRQAGMLGRGATRFAA